MMKIKLSDIPEEGLTLSERVDAGAPATSCQYILEHRSGFDP